MARIIDFYYDFRSPYSYLAFTQLSALATPSAAAIAYHPVDVFAVMARVGNAPTTIQCPAKGRYARIDLGRWAARYGVPLVPNPHFLSLPGQDLLLGAVAAAGLGQAEAYARAVFDGVWTRQSAFADDEETLDALRQGGVEGGEAILAGRAKAAEQLEQEIERAAAEGVFGVPTFRVGEAIFFGNDRLDFIAEELAR